MPQVGDHAAPKRHYLGRGGQPRTFGELDFTKLLSQQALVNRGQLLAHLSERQVQQLLATARQLGSAGEAPTTCQAAEQTVEMAAVQAALHTHQNSPAPDNMFCPFVVVERDSQGHLTRAANPMLHWGNVDTF